MTQTSFQPSLIMPTRQTDHHQGLPEMDDWDPQKTFLLAALDRHERPLTSYAMRINQGDLHAARDAVQHTFMQLCKQSRSKVEHKLAPWLYTVCRNRVLDDLKSNARRSSVLIEELDTIDPHAADPADQFELFEFFQNLRRLMAGFPATECEVIELWSHGLSAAEIAQILKRKPGTVRVSLHRAIKRLKQHPDVSLWLERATGQIGQPDVGSEKTGRSVKTGGSADTDPTSNCHEKPTPFISGERQ